jgi:hypothetical protein
MVIVFVAVAVGYAVDLRIKNLIRPTETFVM